MIRLQKIGITFTFLAILTYYSASAQTNSLIYTGADSQVTVQKGGYGANGVFVLPLDTNINSWNRTRKQGRIAIVDDMLVWYDSAQGKWVSPTTGALTPLDTTTLLATKTDLTKKVDSVTKSNDTFYYWKNGNRVLAGVAPSPGNGYVANQTDTQQNAAYYIDSGFINTIQPFIQKKIVFYGDSRTEGSRLQESSQRWSTIVSKRLGCTEDNRAISGSTLCKRNPLAYSNPPNMVDNATTIPIYNPDSLCYLVISYGYNDMRYNGGDYDSANFRTDYNIVLDTAMINKGWPANHILLTDIWYNTPTSYTPVPPNPVINATQHLAFNFVIKTITQQRGLLFYPSYDYMRRNIGSYGFLLNDSIHDNLNSEKIKAEGALEVLGFELAKNKQQFAVNGLSEFTKIKYHPTDTISGFDFVPLGLDTTNTIVPLPNKMVNVNYTTVPQGARIYVNGQIASGGVISANSEQEDLQCFGLRATYGVFTGNYNGSILSGIKMIAYYSGGGR